MTMIVRREAHCALCGVQSEFLVLASTNSVGSPDLDTRPPGMKRSTMHTWVQRCPDCGYCASDVAAPRTEAAAVVNTSEYKRQLQDPSYPELANSFLCRALIECVCGNYAAATWALLHAAWVCDDTGRIEQAVACRQNAAEMLTRAEEHGQQVGQPEGASTAILVDLLRRSGRFEDSQEALAARRDGIADEVVARVLDFQAVLIDQNDKSCHTIAEAFDRDT